MSKKNNQQSTKPIGQVGFIKVPNIYNKVPNNSIFAFYSELLEEESSDIIMLCDIVLTVAAFQGD